MGDSGLQIEHNDFTGLEIQPSGRVLWKPREGYTIWSSVARAVKTPSRAENDINFNRVVVPPGSPENPGPLPILVAIRGNSDFESEELTAFEVGYRFRMTNSLFWDLAGFYNVYKQLTNDEGVETSVATVQRSEATGDQIVAYVVASNEVDISLVERQLQQQLPGFMLPSHMGLCEGE